MADLPETDRSLFNIAERGSATTPLDRGLMDDFDFAQELRKARSPLPETAFGDFYTGLRSGIAQMGADVRAAGAVGLSLFGAEQDAEELMKLALEIEDSASKRYPKSIERVEEIESIGDFTRWAARALGEQVPVIASIFLGGGTGGLIGKLVGRGAMSLSSVPIVASKFPILSEKIGAGLGMFGTTTGIETGSTGMELFQATGQMQPEASLIAGAMKGVLESVVPAFFGARLGLMPDISAGILRRTIQAYDRILPGRFATAAAAGTIEGATETLQEAIDIGVRGFLDENYDVLGPEARSRILNAAASGAFVGAVFGAAAPKGRVLAPAQDVILDPQTNLPIIDGVKYSTPLGEAPNLSRAVLTDVTRPADSEFGEFIASTEGRNAVPVSEQEQRMKIPTQANVLLGRDVSSFGPTVKSETTQKRYNFEEHKKGSAVWVKDTESKLSPESERDLKSALNFINLQMKRLGLNEHKIIVFADSLQGKFSQNMEPPRPLLSNIFEVDEGFAGHYAGFDNNVSVIALSTKQDGAHFKLAAVHEFGHLLAHRRLAQASPALQQRILSRYKHDLLNATYGDLRNIGRFAAPARLSIMPNVGEFFGPETPADVVQDSRYILSFDEWFAEQITKHFSERAGKLDEVGGFFSSVVRELQQLFERAKTYFGLKAVPEINEFVESLVKNKISSANFALREAEARGEKMNEKLLADVNNGEYVPPPQTSTERAHTLLTKLGVTKSVADKIRATSDKFNWFINLFYNIQQIAKLNPQNFFVNRHVELVDQWHIFQMKWIGRAEERMHDWANLGAKGGERFSQFIFAVDSMEYLTPKERADEVSRQPTDAELTGLGKKYGINEKGLELYYKVRDDFLAVLDAIEQTSLRDIQRTITDPATQIAQSEALSNEMAALRARPYFPHSRFGKYVVVAKDAKGSVLWSEHFPTKGTARAAVPRVQAQFKQAGLRIDLAESPEGMQVFFGLPPSLLSKIRNHLQLSKQQQEFLDNLIVEMAPSTSFRHKLQKRANVPGFSLDAKRAYADYFFFGSRHLARIEYKPLMEENIEAYGSDINAIELAPGAPVDVTKARRLRNMLVQHMEHILNSKPDWASLRSAATHWYLGFGVSSAAINLMQVPMVGWPYVASRFGDVKGAAAIIEAVKSIRDMYKYKDQDRVSDSELKIIGRGMSEGVLEESQAAELAGTAHQEYLGKFLPGTKIQRMYQRFGHMSMWMFQQGERFNRRVMFRAGMKLALRNPNAKHLKELQSRYSLEMDQLVNEENFSQSEAIAYLSARDAVWTSQFQYAQHARPKFMQGKKGAFFMFYMYTQGILHFTRHDPGRVRFLVMMLFMAGMMGLPGADDLASLAKLLARTILGKDFDVEREVREFVIGMTGDAIPPDLILHGIGRIGLGLPTVMDILGLPKADIDISRRIGLGRIIPGLHELGQPGLDYDKAMANVTTQAAGAAFGIGFNMLKAMTDDSLPVDDFKRWERAMPLALGNLTKAIRLAREERERARTGATVVDFDMADPDHVAEVVFRGLGFQPTRLQRQWDKIAAQREVQMYWATRKGILLKHLNHSYDTDNQDLREDTLEAIRRFNGEVPFGSIAIAGDTIRKSRLEHVRQKRLREAGLTKEKAYRPLVREVEGLFPETRKEPEIMVEGTGSMR